jgi:predicted LPLAT superfamily acyltransferase
MRLPRRGFVIALTILLAMVGALAVLVVRADRQAGKRYFRDLKRDARGPWPKERVEQAVISRSAGHYLDKCLGLRGQFGEEAAQLVRPCAEGPEAVA